MKVVRFLRAVPVFIDVNGKEYGPFANEDLATIPEANAQGLEARGWVQIIKVEQAP